MTVPEIDVLEGGKKAQYTDGLHIVVEKKERYLYLKMYLREGKYTD